MTNISIIRGLQQMESVMRTRPEYSDRMADAVYEAIRIVEKQMGRPPKWENIYKCGSCGKILGANECCVDYCYSCGQKIDWDDVESPRSDMSW